MEMQLTIISRNLTLDGSVEGHIRERAERLNHFPGRILGCRVVVEGPGPHHKHGPLKVAVELKVPGPNIRVNRQSDEDLFLAIREAFDAAGRRLEDSVRRRRGFVKAHGG